MGKIKFTTVLTGVTLACALAIGSTAALSADPTKIGFVYVGPVGDHGWSYQHHEGLKALKKEFGDKIKTTHVEKVSEGPDAERVIRQLAQQGHKVIFTTSFGYMNPTIKVAKRYPKVRFEHATGFKRSKNVSTYNIRYYEGRYVAGVIAGKMTKSNTIGYIASFPIPEVVRGINAAYLGAKSVNPKVKFKIIWVSTWFDPGKEADAAKALADQGADVLFQHTDSPAAMKLAEQKGISAIGQASNMKAFGPKAQLTALVNNWGDYYISRVKAAMDGSWKSTDTWGGIKSGMLKFASWNKRIPADVVKMAEAARDKIASGDLHPFTGPMKNQAGKMFLKAGQKMADKDLAGMKFYVEGIDGKLPK